MDVKNQNHNILIVDDEPLIRKSLYEILRIEGYNVQMADTAEAALEIIHATPMDIVVTDLKLPQMSGLDLLTHIKKETPKTEVILITGFGSIESAVAAMKTGAFDYVSKPINDNEIKIIINKIIEKKALLAENENLKKILAKERPSSFGDMIGQSSCMQKVYHIINSVASTNATILINGESGTGKGLVAKAIHANDKNRCDKPFIEISCGALSETLLESELFGHMKGSFTGAIKDKKGRFEFADGGTIFLDEIDAFSLNLQVKLLRVLQDGVFERVGDNITRHTNARIIVATNQNLLQLIEDGTFREDLYYRVNVIAIKMPPLRERKEDIPLIVKHYLQYYSCNSGKTIKGLTPEVEELFQQYPWPGNIRELENAIEGAVIMTQSSTIQFDDIPNSEKFVTEADCPEENPDEKSLKKVVEEPEKEHIITVLEECHWNRNRAAAMLGINRTTLYNKIKKYNIQHHNP